MLLLMNRQGPESSTAQYYKSELDFLLKKCQAMINHLICLSYVVRLKVFKIVTKTSLY